MSYPLPKAMCRLGVAVFPLLPLALGSHASDVSTCTPGSIGGWFQCTEEQYQDAHIEAQDLAEMGEMAVQLVQTKLKLGTERKARYPVANDATSATLASSVVSSEHSSVEVIPTTSVDHNGNICLMCGAPLAERLGNKTYAITRKDCGSRSTPTGPRYEDLVRPAVAFIDAARDTNGFCELNFAKSCVDAVANQDYLYWAKSLDLRHPTMRQHAGRDALYCRVNGFLAPDVVRLQSNFTGMQQKAAELCGTRYAKHNISTLSFLNMTSTWRSDGEEPSQSDAEVLAAWNCAMGDLGCDMAMCAYSFCDKGNGVVGVYDECSNWDPVQGMI